MNTVINAWGTDGVLTMTALAALSCMGVMSGCKKTMVQLLTDNADTENIAQLKSLISAYNDYYVLLYNEGKNLLFSDHVPLFDLLSAGSDTESSLLDKYGDNNASLLSLGCSRNEITCSANECIHDRTGAGEAFFSSVTDLKCIYRSNDISSFIGDEAVIINCADHCGDPASAAFVALENRMTSDMISRAVQPRLHRYNVLSGPYEKTENKIVLRYASVLGNDFPDEADVFDIPRYIRKMKERLFSLSDDERKKVERDIAALSAGYAAVFSSEHDNGNLDPNDQLDAFIENLLCDENSVSAVFINLKTDGTRLLPPDIVSRDADPLNGKRAVNIINLLNALSVIEIERAYEKYTDGGVYSFGSEQGNMFELRNLFERRDLKRVIGFLVSCVMFRVYLPELIDIESNACTAGKSENSLSPTFHSEIGKKLNDMCENFCLSVINVFREIDRSSDLAFIFPDKLYSFFDDTAEIIQKSGSAKAAAQKMIEYIISFVSTDDETSTEAYKTAQTRLFAAVESEFNDHSTGETASDHFCRLARATAAHSESFTKMVIR